MISEMQKTRAVVISGTLILGNPGGADECVRRYAFFSLHPTFAQSTLGFAMAD
jgi:hypothetical protein